MAAPFATISACARIAQAGDTCVVHAGHYRETVSPANSGTAALPIVFTVADSECATVSGTEPLAASFAPQAGNVWVAPAPDPIMQMFSNGEILWEAQWPNRTPGVLFDVPKATAGQGTGAKTGDGSTVTTLVDPNIPAGDWTGAMVFIIPGSKWQSDSRPVLAYDQTSHTVTFDTTVPWAEKSTQPVPSNPYFLYGSTLALDSQDEWVWKDGNLFYYSTDDPQSHGLEYKKRLYAFDVAQSYVELVGFRVFGAAVRLTGNNDTVDSLAISYPTHLRSFNAYYTEGDVNRIVGNDNVWKNSRIEKSGSAGLLIAGHRNLIENNVITDVAYQATNHAGIDMDDWTKTYTGNLILYNTVARSGRSGIFLYGDQGGRVLYNKVSDWALLTNDMGGIYAWGTDGQGTEIAYNDVGGSAAFWSNGIYLDDKTKHFVAHHNFVHDSEYFAFCIKQENDYFNNTIANVGTPFLVDKDFQVGQWTNTNSAKVENDLGDQTLLVRVGLLPTAVTDYGYWEAPVHVGPVWTHVQIPFASLYQPGWFAQVPLDLTAIKQFAFTAWTNGDYQFDLDNLALVDETGKSPTLMVDAFESPGGANGLGGYAWGGASGDGVSSTSGKLGYASGGASAASTKYAHFAGTMVLGDNSWGLMTESLSQQDISAYTAIAFDIRGQRDGLRVLATGGNSPVQDHNGSCALQPTPTCAVGQGIVIPGITDGFAGAAPDLGAFETTLPPWSAGAQRPADVSGCGKIADATGALPPPYQPQWAQSDAGASDASVSPTGDASAPSAPTAGTGAASGCSCRIADRGENAGLPVLSMAALVLLFTRRRRPES